MEQTKGQKDKQWFTNTTEKTKQLCNEPH